MDKEIQKECILEQKNEIMPLKSFCELTKCEINILWAVIQGLDNKKIGKYLSISPRTVKFHLSSLFSKTNTRNRTELTQKTLLYILNITLDFSSFLKIFA